MNIAEMIKATVKHTVWGWKGMLRVSTPQETYMDEGILVIRPEQRYTKLCGATRVTRIDAMADAEDWRQAFITINQLP